MLLPPLIIFVLGTLIGSFLNVVVYRFRTGKGLGGRSMCMSCSKTLSWQELIPIVSFFVQKGKCIGCGSKISWQYPIVEAVTGIVFASLVFKFYVPALPLGQFLPPLLFAMFIMSLLIVISVYDIRHMVIPNRLVYLFIALAFFNLFISPKGITIPSLNYVIGGILLPLPFFILWHFSHGRLMGLGDIKLMAGMGFLLGIAGGAVALMIAFWSGAIVSIVLLFLAKRKYTMKSEIPFGPFLVFSTFLVYAFTPIIANYISFLAS